MAIIAILAAIAVPNLLEAQVRAKVARVRNDLRILAMALDAYMVDHNTYPFPCSTADNPYHRMLAYSMLSTPVAYLTSGVLRDPFAAQRAVSGTMDRDNAAYEMAFANPGGRAGDLDAWWLMGRWTRRVMFLLHSLGPDCNNDTALRHFGGLDAAGQPYAPARIYDPTNGTISIGDIYRVQAPLVFMRYYEIQGSR